MKKGKKKMKRFESKDLSVLLLNIKIGIVYK